MAPEPTLREFAEQIANVFHEYAEVHGWPSDSYKLYLRFSEQWNTAHVVLVTDRFDEKELREKWKEIMGFLDQKLHIVLKYIIMFNITLRTYSQIAEGGIYELGPEFRGLEEILGTRPMV